MRSRASLVPGGSGPARRSGREISLLVLAAALAAGTLAAGIVLEQYGETLFNATLV